jgi:hypothetical protein
MSDRPVGQLKPPDSFSFETGGARVSSVRNDTNFPTPNSETLQGVALSLGEPLRIVEQEVVPTIIVSPPDSDENTQNTFPFWGEDFPCPESDMEKIHFQNAHAISAIGTGHRENASRRALDLFCGNKSVGSVLQEKGFEVISLDIDPKRKPTICVDILRWDFHIFPPEYFVIICAGVPCTEYSIAKTKGKRDLLGADKLVQKTLEIVAYFQPGLWWIENPRTGFLTKRECIQEIPYIDVDYCQFSDWGYQKPTRIWGSASLLKLGDRLCDPRFCPNVVRGEGGHMRHKESLGGYDMKTTTQLRWRMPKALVEFLLTALNDKPRQGAGMDFAREDYTIKMTFLRDIEERFGVKIQRDCFAAPHNARCEKYFTKRENALQKLGDGRGFVVEPSLDIVAEGCKKIKRGAVHGHLPVPRLGERMGAETFPPGHQKISLRRGDGTFRSKWQTHGRHSLGSLGPSRGRGGDTQIHSAGSGK